MRASVSDPLGSDVGQGVPQPLGGVHSGARDGGAEPDQLLLAVPVALFLFADLLCGPVGTARVRTILSGLLPQPARDSLVFRGGTYGLSIEDQRSPGASGWMGHGPNPEPWLAGWMWRRPERLQAVFRPSLQNSTHVQS